MTRPAKPQDIGGILDAGFRLYARGLKGVLLLTFMSSLISVLPSVVMGFLPMMGQDMGNIMRVAIAMVVLVPLYILVTLSIMAAVIAKLAARAEGRSLGMGEAIRHGLRVFLKVLASGILYGLAVIGGFVLLIIPGVYISLALMLGMYAIILDNLGPLEALRRSHHLVKGNWWRTAVVITIPMMIYGSLIFGLQVPLAFAAMSFQNNILLSTLITQLGNLIMGTLLSPMIYAVTICLYRDLKLRKEGGDLLVRIRKATAEPQPCAPDVLPS